MQKLKDKIIRTGGGTFGNNAPKTTVDSSIGPAGTELANTATNGVTVSVARVPLWRIP